MAHKILLTLDDDYRDWVVKRARELEVTDPECIRQIITEYRARQGSDGGVISDEEVVLTLESLKERIIAKRKHEQAQKKRRAK